MVSGLGWLLVLCDHHRSNTVFLRTWSLLVINENSTQQSDFQHSQTLLFLLPDHALAVEKSFCLDDKFKPTYRLPINHRHIYRSDYQANTARSEQKGRMFFPESKQACSPGGMNANTETHLPEMFCPRLLN